MTRVAVERRLVTWARERAGRSLESLASRFPKLSDWESGDAQPTLKQLEDFARAVHVPVGYMFLLESPEEPVPIPDFRTMPGASLDRPTPDLLDTIYLCQRRQEWYNVFAREMGDPSLPSVDRCGWGDDVVRSAATIREALGFDVAARRRMSTWTDALRLFIQQADEVEVLVMVSGS